MYSGSWRKSSHSGGYGYDHTNCVEVGRAWRKSSRSGQDTHNVGSQGGNCVEAGQVDEFVALRDTKDRERGMVTVSRAAFAKLLTGLR